MRLIMKIPEDMQQGSVHKMNNYGDLEVIQYFNSKKVRVKFVDTGFETTAQSGHIRLSRVKDMLKPDVFGVGYTGFGKYRQSKNKRAYSVWANMLKRCYYEDRSKRDLSYVNCSVHPEWHNFQNFAEWFDLNYIEGFHLDKDKLIHGNRVYGKDACCFISHKENVELSQARSAKLTSPCGEVVELFNLNKFCRDNKLSRGNIQMVLNGGRQHHKGWRRCPE